MFDILTVILFFLLVFLVVVLLSVLLVIKAAQWLFEPTVKEVVNAVEEKREHNWRRADAAEREKMVRKSCGWRVIGRVAGASVLVAGASAMASPVLAVMWCVAAWRTLKPIKQEMRDACAYRSTGAEDEPHYSSGDGTF